MDDIDDDDDDDDDEDLDMRDATPEPDELDEEIVESDLELEEDTLPSDHDDPPQKVEFLCHQGPFPLLDPQPQRRCVNPCFLWQMGDPSVEVTEENRDASQEAKGKAMEAMSEGTSVFSHIDVFLCSTPGHV